MSLDLNVSFHIPFIMCFCRCKEGNERVDENLFPAQNEESKLHLNKRTVRKLNINNI